MLKFKLIVSYSLSIQQVRKLRVAKAYTCTQIQTQTRTDTNTHTHTHTQGLHGELSLDRHPSIIKTHTRVSAAKKGARTHQCVIYATGQVADFSLS